MEKDDEFYENNNVIIDANDEEEEENDEIGQLPVDKNWSNYVIQNKLANNIDKSKYSQTNYQDFFPIIGKVNDVNFLF